MYFETVDWACRFQKLDSRVPVMQSAQDCMCDDVPEGLDRASVWCILPKRNMRTPPIIIGGELRKDPPQVLFVEHDQMIGTLAPDRPDQPFGKTILPRRCWCDGFVANAHGSQSTCNGGAIDAIPIADEVERRRIPRESLS